MGAQFQFVDLYVCGTCVSVSWMSYYDLFLPEVNVRGAPNSEMPWYLGYSDMDLRSGTLDGLMDWWMDG